MRSWTPTTIGALPEALAPGLHPDTMQPLTEVVLLREEQDSYVGSFLPPRRPSKELWNYDFDEPTYVRQLTAPEYATAHAEYEKAKAEYEKSGGVFRVNGATKVTGTFRTENGSEVRGVWRKDTGWYWTAREARFP